MAESNGKLHDAAEIDAEAARLREIKERGWAALESIWEKNKDEDPDEVLAEVTAEIEAYRQEEYERRARAEASRR